MQDFETELKQRVERINEDLISFLPKEEGYQKTVISACNYSVINGGKRLRPLLMEAAYEICGGKAREELLPFMAAIEMIHSFSLVHDDLPCMDNDELRRGKPSTWAKYGADMGTLSGDGLSLFAFETALKSKAEPERKLRALEILAERSGIYGMIGGQALDVELTGNIPDPDSLLFIYREKTGALLSAALTIGAVLAGADEEKIEMLSLAGTDLGLAFQIRDDILDVTSTKEELGKSVHADDRNAKITWVTFNGLSESQKAVESYTRKALDNITSFPGNEFLSALMSFLIDRKY